MITGTQIRAARGALDWSAQELSDRSGVSLRTLLRFEEVDTVPANRSSTLQLVQEALEAAGVEFIGAPDNAPGIRLHKIRD
jgi:transcriptional regulator with XRE-family HTH domain